mgnify:CR=1 FL=1
MTKFIIGDISTFPVTSDPAEITGSLKVSGSSANARVDIEGGTGGPAIRATGSVEIKGDLTVTGTTTTVTTDNTLVKDKLITLNDGGAASSGGDAGIEIEEDGGPTGYIKTSSDRAKWELKVPSTENVLFIQPSVNNKTLSIHDDTALDQNLRTTDSPQFASVGIGTASPDNALEVLSSTSPQVRITHTDNTDYATLGVDSDGQLTITTVDGGGTGGHISLMPDGNVGIGSASPTDKLEVVGNITAKRNFPDVTLKSLNSSEEGRFLWSDAGGAAWGAIKMQPNDTAPMRFFTSGIVAADEKMRITSDGNVGIGTTNPTDKLEVVGNITAKRNFPDVTLKSLNSSEEGRFLWSDAGGAAHGAIKMQPNDTAPMRFFTSGIVASDEKMRITSAGKVGMGTTNPETVLHVSSSSSSEAALTVDGGVVFNRTKKSTADGEAGASITYTILESDYLIGCTTTTGRTIALTLPKASECQAGQQFVIKDEGGLGGDPSTQISVTCDTGDTIDGNGTGAGAPLNPVEFTSAFSALTFYTDGVTGWFIY